MHRVQLTVAIPQVVKTALRGRKLSKSKHSFYARLREAGKYHATRLRCRGNDTWHTHMSPAPVPGLTEPCVFCIAPQVYGKVFENVVGFAQRRPDM